MPVASNSLRATDAPHLVDLLALGVPAVGLGGGNPRGAHPWVVLDRWQPRRARVARSLLVFRLRGEFPRRRRGPDAANRGAGVVRRSIPLHRDHRVRPGSSVDPAETGPQGFDSDLGP